MKFQKEMLETLFRDCAVNNERSDENFSIVERWLAELQEEEPYLYSSLVGMMEGCSEETGLNPRFAMNMMGIAAMFVEKAYKAKIEIDELERQFS